ncbi:MAG: hypothetical protein ACOC6J_03085 [Spirochaetota bacterium]
MTKLTSARPNDTTDGSSLLDALVGVVLVSAALLAAATLLAPTLRTLASSEAELRALERTLVEAFE